MKNLSLFLLIVLLVGCAPGNNDQAPEIETQLIDGTPFKLSELKGNYVVLDFWGSWCGPCLVDAPKLVALHEKFGDRVVFVSIAFEKNDKRWQQTAERLGFSWKHQIVEISPVLLGSGIARDYGVSDIPAKFIVTPDGKLISGMDFDQMDEFLSNSAL
ncbi:MAG: TlpA family protein disulfide reductase [Flavobacteriales bacterium]|nr:TlpA family protein disulfide reductase [Flavobacteriales bacterium]